jgi:crotonobetainyl-CoA:carnitine CoA-transferase CaiB-like acyl-CoA transferase
VIAAWTGSLDLDEALAVLNAAEVPAGRIYDIADIVRDPQYLARGMIQSVTLPDGSTLKLPGIVPRLEGTPGGMDWVGPALGEHTREVLRSAGLEDGRIDQLADRGIVKIP